MAGLFVLLAKEERCRVKQTELLFSSTEEHSTGISAADADTAEAPAEVLQRRGCSLTPAQVKVMQASPTSPKMP